MKMRLMEKMKQMTALSLILGCLLCSFFLSVNEIPDLPERQITRESADRISQAECSLTMEDARELSSGTSRSIYLKKDSIKKQTAGSLRLLLAVSAGPVKAVKRAELYGRLSVGTVLVSHQFLMNFIHDQDGEK